MKAYTKEYLEPLVRESATIEDLLEKLSIKNISANVFRVRKYMNQLGIDRQDFMTGVHWIDYSVDDISNGTRIRTNTIKSFLNYHKVKEVCKICGLNSWNGSPIVLDIDHIDSDPINNHIDNLQYLCPNCHRQKTREDLEQEKIENPIIRKPKPRCECGAEISKDAKKCKPCARIGSKQYMVDELPISYFTDRVWNETIAQIAKDLNVTSKCVINYLKRNKIVYPPHRSGYWKSIKAGNLEKARIIKEESIDSLIYP